MCVITIHPNLTVREDETASLFYHHYEKELKEHVDIRPIVSKTGLYRTELNGDDLIVLFFRSDEQYSTEIQDFLGDAADKGCKFFSISLNRAYRIPPGAVAKSQSYDIEEHLRNRSLTPSHLSTVANAFSRMVLSEVQPTLTKGRMHLFISHRRIDGEDIAAALCKSFRKQAESAFRDLLDVGVGEEAQEVIEENLRKSDAVIFLETPRSWESDWIAKELRIALSLNLPIVWVRIGTHDPENKLKVTPVGVPHFIIDDMDSLQTEFDPVLVNKIIDKAFNISREHANNVFDQFYKLRSLAKRNGGAIKPVNKRLMLYEVQIPRPSSRYWQRPMTHLIQLYGRFPKQDDKLSFRPLTHEYGYEHPTLGTYYDAALMLAPIPNQVGLIPTDIANGYVDSFDDYIQSLEQVVLPLKLNLKVKNGIIVSGAFPDCEPEYQQYLSNAVHSVARAILERSDTLIFGGHPTFQYPLLDLAKRIRPENNKDAVRLYLSRWYVTDPMISEMSTQATVTTTDAVNNRDDSLSLMRKTMIRDKGAIALIVMGGKTEVGGHTPGVDEEISLARSVGMPVFVIGSVGGRSAQIASELDADGWRAKWNDLSVEENQLLMNSMDYRLIADLILNHLGL